MIPQESFVIVVEVDPVQLGSFEIAAEDDDLRRPAGNGEPGQPAAAVSRLCRDPLCPFRRARGQHTGRSRRLSATPVPRADLSLLHGGLRRPGGRTVGAHDGKAGRIAEDLRALQGIRPNHRPARLAALAPAKARDLLHQLGRTQRRSGAAGGAAARAVARCAGGDRRRASPSRSLPACESRSYCPNLCSRRLRRPRLGAFGTCATCCFRCW